jgi:hypothetical protein
MLSADGAVSLGAMIERVRELQSQPSSGLASPGYGVIEVAIAAAEYR